MTAMYLSLLTSSSIDRNKQYAGKERRNLCTHECFAETVQGRTGCVKVNGEDGRNEGKKATQP